MCIGFDWKIVQWPMNVIFFHVADNENFRHYGGVEVIKGVADNLAEVSIDPLNLFSWYSDFLGNSIGDDGMTQYFSLSQRSPLICGVLFSCVWPFSYSIFLFFHIWSRSSRIP